jgi:glucokinase
MRQAISVDLGGTQIRAAIVDEAGNVHHRIATQTRAQDGPDVIVAQMAQAARSLPKNNATAVGVSSPGPLDTEAGIAIHLPNFKNFVNYPLRQALQDKLGLTVHLENDGIAAAIGEWRYGAGQGLHSMVYVTVSTGIGGGVIVNNTVLRGHKGLAGHVGHLCIDHRGFRCNCGNTGCWERYAAGPFFAARSIEKAANTSSSLAALTSNLQPADVFSHARQGDQLAQSLVDEEARYLGVGLVSLMHLYSPQKIVIGGGMSNAFDQLRPGIEAFIQDNAISEFRKTPIVTAALQGNSGLVGAAAMVFENETIVIPAKAGTHLARSTSEYP